VIIINNITLNNGEKKSILVISTEIKVNLKEDFKRSIENWQYRKRIEKFENKLKSRL